MLLGALNGQIFIELSGHTCSNSTPIKENTRMNKHYFSETGKDKTKIQVQVCLLHNSKLVERSLI